MLISIARLWRDKLVAGLLSVAQLALDGFELFLLGHFPFFEAESLPIGAFGHVGASCCSSDAGGLLLRVSVSRASRSMAAPIRRL